MPLFSGVKLNGNSVCNIVNTLIVVTMQSQISDILLLVDVYIGFVGVGNNEIVALFG